MLPLAWLLDSPGFLDIEMKKFLFKGCTTMTPMPGFARKSSSLVCSRANLKRCRWPKNSDHNHKPSFSSRQPPRRWWRAEAHNWGQAEPSARTWEVFWTSRRRKRGGRWSKVSLNNQKKSLKKWLFSETAPPWWGEASPVSGEGRPAAGERCKVSFSLLLAPSNEFV